MATSGTTTWTLNRDQVIKGALRKLAVLPSGGTPSTNQISDANEALNAIVKAYQADGMPLWKISYGTVNTTTGVSSYVVGPGTGNLTSSMPLKIVQAFSRPSGGGTAVPMNIYTNYDYFNLLPSSSNTGAPVNLYYQPLRTYGTIYVWPTPDSSYFVSVTYQSLYEDMTNSTDEFDFPSYWIQALIYALAWSMAPEYGIPPTDRNILAQEAKYWKEEALSFMSEEGSLFLQPNRDYF